MSEFSKEYVEKNQPEVGNPEQAKRYLDIANNHSIKSRAFERKANDLESQIRRKIQPELKMSEVNSLRRQAESEKREAEKYKRYAEFELRKPVYGEVANEFGEQTEKNKSGLSKIKEGNVENSDSQIISVEDSIQIAESAARSILKEIAGIPAEKMNKKFDLSKEENAALSEIDSMFNGDISFTGIKGYKKGNCNGKEIPIYD